jgi:hypothetical protein
VTRLLKAPALQFIEDKHLRHCKIRLHIDTQSRTFKNDETLGFSATSAEIQGAASEGFPCHSGQA